MGPTVILHKKTERHIINVRNKDSLTFWKERNDEIIIMLLSYKEKKRLIMKKLLLTLVISSSVIGVGNKYFAKNKVYYWYTVT